MTSFFEKLFSGKSADKADKADKKVPKKVELLSTSLNKSSQGFFSRLVNIFSKKIDSGFLEEVEEVLLSSDVGVATTAKIIEKLDVRFSKNLPANTEELFEVLRDEIQELLPHRSKISEINTEKKPYIILIVGINGVGKTTSIAKLAHHYQEMGKKVMLGAADTFRAAATEQLTIWADRLNIPIVKQKQGADPASVAFDTLQSAKAKNMDIVIIDTAGRLHNNSNLMKELEHIKRVIQKFEADAPQEVLLVLDATTGQNAIAQAKEFSKATQVTGIFLTKLDGSAKGGVILGIADQLNIPIQYLGLGEKENDMVLFEKDIFIDLFFKKKI